MLVERSIYDAYGQFVIERRDASAPVVERILGHPQGFVVEFSEPVFAPLDASPTAGSVSAATTPVFDTFGLSDGPNPIQVTAVFDPTLPGSPHGTAILVKAANTNTPLSRRRGRCGRR